MADLTVTAREVRPLAGAMVRSRIAGAAGNVGDLVYTDSAGKVQQADGDAAGTTKPACGVVVSAGTLGKTTFAANDPVDVVTLGPVGGFSGMTPGTVGYVSVTAGKIGDTAAINVKAVGYAETATIFFVQPGFHQA